MIRHDEGLTGHADVRGARTPNVKWRFDTGHSIGTASPVIAADESIYVGNDAGTLLALHPDGTLAWRVELGYAIEGAAAITSDQTIYVGANDGRVHVFDATGHEVASAQTRASVQSSLIVDAQGVAYFGTDRETCSASRGGDVQCTFVAVVRPASATAAIAGGVLITFGGAGAIGNAASGTIAYGLGTFGAATSDGTAYMVDQDHVSVVDVTGANLWTAYVATANDYFAPDAPLAIANPSLVYLRMGHSVLAVPQTGGELWRADVGATVTTALAVDSEGVVYFGTDDGALRALDASGAPLFSVKTGGPVRSSPAIGGDGTVYFGSDDGFLYAVGP